VNAVSSAITSFFDMTLGPFSGMSPYVAMTIVSVVTGLVLLFAYKYTTNQQGMKRTKDRLKAHFLEVLIYRDDLRNLVSTQKHLAIQNLRYSAYALPALPILVCAVLPVMAQLELRYGHRPLAPGESTIVSLQLQDRIPDEDVDVEFVPPPGIVVETPVLRIRDQMEADWRIHAEEPGRHELLFRVGNEEVHKEIVVGKGGPAKIKTKIVKPNFWDALLYPGEAPIDQASMARAVEIQYPDYRFIMAGKHLHWLVVFMIVSLAFGFALKPFAHVE
jgi:uncharacterized membrane protein (DUF106 family)